MKIYRHKPLIFSTLLMSTVALSSCTSTDSLKDQSLYNAYDPALSNPYENSVWNKAMVEPNIPPRVLNDHFSRQMSQEWSQRNRPNKEQLRD